ncbi:MAG: UDP-glucose 4-epimerase GalE [Pseudomonadota bacterium]
MAQAILVAGGAGYIGAHVCKALAAAGYTPVTLDDLSAGHADFVRFGPLVRACVSDGEAVARTIAEYGIVAVIDLAGSIEVGASVSDPLHYYDNNLAKKIRFLRTLAIGGVRAFVFSSTAAVYGEPQAVPIHESHPCQPKNPYGWSKLMFEQLLRDFAAAGGPNFMALRYFNAAGASPDGDIGEAHDPETHLIPRACLASLGRIAPLEIFGNDYDTPDGTAIRDYIHVSDLAAAHVRAVEALLRGAPSAAYNLGNGIGTSIGDILQCFARIGHPVPHRFAPRRAGDPTRLVADASAARAALGWAPAHTDIEMIVRSAYQWHQSNPSQAA